MITSGISTRPIAAPAGRPSPPRAWLTGGGGQRVRRSKRELECRIPRLRNYVLPQTPGGFRRLSEISARARQVSCRYSEERGPRCMFLLFVFPQAPSICVRAGWGTRMSQNRRVVAARGLLVFGICRDHGFLSTAHTQTETSRDPREDKWTAPNLSTKLIPTKICWLKVSGKIPVDLGIPPLKLRLCLSQTPWNPES